MAQHRSCHGHPLEALVVVFLRNFPIICQQIIPRFEDQLLKSERGAPTSTREMSEEVDPHHSKEHGTLEVHLDESIWSIAVVVGLEKSHWASK